MAEWLVRVIGKQRKEIDKHLLVQAVIALGRQLWQEEQAARETEDTAISEREGTA